MARLSSPHDQTSKGTLTSIHAKTSSQAWTTIQMPLLPVRHLLELHLDWQQADQGQGWTAEPPSCWLLWPLFRRSWRCPSGRRGCKIAATFIACMCWRDTSGTNGCSSYDHSYNRRHLQYPGWQRYTFLAFCHLIMIFVLREAYVDVGIWPLKWEIAVHPILQGDNYLFSCLSWDPKWDELSKVHNPHFCMVLLTWRRQCNIYFFKSQDWLCALAKGTLFPQRPLEESFYSEVGSRSAQSFYHLLLPQCGLFPPKY